MYHKTDISGLEVHTQDNSRYNWPSLINSSGETLLSLHEGSGDERYDNPQVAYFDPRIEPFFDDAYKILLTHCK